VGATKGELHTDQRGAGGEISARKNPALFRQEKTINPGKVHDRENEAAERTQLFIEKEKARGADLGEGETLQPSKKGPREFLTKGRPSAIESRRREANGFLHERT